MSWKLEDLEQTLLIGSTLVEGSTLSEAEARQVLAGRTVQGHPITEIRELLNYRAAVEWLMSQLTQAPYLSRDLVLGFHQRLFVGFPGEHGRWKTHQNYTYLSNGNRFDYAHPSLVEKEMREWTERFNSQSPDGAATEDAARLYHEFQCIHPFDDGNGRIGRILIAYWLHWKAKLSLKFQLKDKAEHLAALERADAGDLTPLTRFFKKRTTQEKGRR
jgi:Fic family protein